MLVRLARSYIHFMHKTGRIVQNESLMLPSEGSLLFLRAILECKLVTRGPQEMLSYAPMIPILFQWDRMLSQTNGHASACLCFISMSSMVPSDA